VKFETLMVLSEMLPSEFSIVITHNLIALSYCTGVYMYSSPESWACSHVPSDWS